MSIVNPGYRGIAYLDEIGTGTNVRFSDADVSAKQEVRADDLIMGDWDRDAYNYGPITVGGSISGPVTETFTGGITGCDGVEPTGDDGVFQWGAQRQGTCGSLQESGLTLYYYCDSDTGEGRYKTFTGMKVNSLNFSCSAGDVAQFSIEVMGKTASAWGEGAIPHVTSAEKLITWDKVSVSIGTPGCPNETRGDDGWIPEAGAPMTALNYSNFSFDINNNSLVDYIEWNVPHLSNQTYELILQYLQGEYVELLVRTSDNLPSDLPRDEWTEEMYEEERTGSGKQGYIVDVKPEGFGKHFPVLKKKEDVIIIKTRLFSLSALFFILYEHISFVL